MWWCLFGLVDSVAAAVDYCVWGLLFACLWLVCFGVGLYCNSLMVVVARWLLVILLCFGLIVLPTAVSFDLCCVFWVAGFDF